MLKSFNLLLLVLSLTAIVYSQTPKASFVWSEQGEVQVDSKYIIWHAFVIDSAWLGVHLTDGSLPRRENGTYKYWLSDVTGELIPIRKIDYRLPIFQSPNPTVVNAITDTTYFWNLGK